VLRELKSIARRVLRPPLHGPEVRLAHDFLGTDYGGWPLLSEYTPPGPLIFSFGVGEDISFDLAAIDRFSATVHAFDPTPRSLAWIRQQRLPERFHFHPIGIAAEDGSAEFFAPTRDVNVSYSASPNKGSDPALAVRAPVKRLSTILAELGTPTPDVLKMDIEGFEYDVLPDILSSGLRPPQILVEFHHRMYGYPNNRTEDAVNRLRKAGYLLYFVSESTHEYAFVLGDRVA